MIFRHRLLAMVSRLMVCLVLCLGGSHVIAQGVSSPGSGHSATRGAEPVEDANLAAMASEFGSIKAAAYLSDVVAVAVGLVVFVYRRRLLMTYSRTSGAVVSALLAPIVFAVLTALLTSAEGAACASASLGFGTNATDYDDICRVAREGAANAFWVASAFRALFIPDGSGYVMPIGAGVLKALSYFAVPFVATMGFVVLHPLAKKLFVRT